MKLLTLKMTCDICPSQWEGTLEDGRMLYVRYRWGGIVIQVSPEPTTDIVDAVDGITLVDEDWGDSYSGKMTLEELQPFLEKAGIQQ